MGIRAYRDLSGNNPTHHLLDIAKSAISPAVDYGTAVDATAADVYFDRVARAVYLSDSDATPLATRDVEVIDIEGTKVIFANVALGSILDIQCIGLGSNTQLDNCIPLY